MFLFALVLVLAAERVVVKSPTMHIQYICEQYLSLLYRFGLKNWQTSLGIVVLAIPPAFIVAVVSYLLPSVFYFLFVLSVLWICIGCPYTRKYYKAMLGKADSEDSACLIEAKRFCSNIETIDDIAPALVVVNYLQYASLILVFVFFDLSIFVWFCFVRQLSVVALNSAVEQASEELEQTSSLHSGDVEVEKIDNVSSIQTLQRYLEFLPSRTVAFAYLLVGNFSKGIVQWLHKSLQINADTHSYLVAVARASEDISVTDSNVVHQSQLMVRLAKRTIVFLLMVVSVLTLTGFIS